MNSIPISMKRRSAPSAALVALGLSILAPQASAYTYTWDVGSFGDDVYNSTTGDYLYTKGAQYHHWVDGITPGESWSVLGSDHGMSDPMIAGHTFYGVGQLSWCQSGACAVGGLTSLGWNHTTQHVRFSLEAPAEVTISLSNAAAAQLEPPNEEGGALGNDLKPGFTLYQGVSLIGNNALTHTFTNRADFLGLDYYDDVNAGTGNTVSKTYQLAAGDWSLWIGGNYNNVQNNDTTLYDLPFETYTDINGNPQTHRVGYGSHGKNFALSIATAPVPVPAAVWLFGSALAGMGVIGRRRDQRVARA